jgi:glycine cleavage system H protein
MSDVPNDLRYTEEHEYLRATDEDGVYLVGITDYAQGELGDVVFLELPSEGDSFEGKASFGTIEAVKAVSDLYCPVAGEIVEVNGDLEDDPALVNRDPYGEGWMVRLRVSDPDQVASLMDADQYRRHLGE